MGCISILVIVQVILVFMKWGGAIDLTWFEVFLPSIIVIGIPVGFSFIKDALSNTTSLN